MLRQVFRLLVDVVLDENHDYNGDNLIPDHVVLVVEVLPAVSIELDKKHREMLRIIVLVEGFGDFASFVLLIQEVLVLEHFKYDKKVDLDCDVAILLLWLSLHSEEDLLEVSTTVLVADR